VTFDLHRVFSLLLVGLTLLPIGCDSGTTNFLRGRGATESEPPNEGSKKGGGDGDDPSKDDPPLDPNDPKVQAFMKDVKPIFDRRCAECHHAGGPALDLTAMPKANTKATMEKVLATLNGPASSMPPAPREKMTQEEIAIVKSWKDTL
jgi:hypothetical protein